MHRVLSSRGASTFFLLNQLCSAIVYPRSRFPLKLHYSTFSAPNRVPNVRRSALPPSSLFVDSQADTFSNAGTSTSLKELLLRISHVCPETSRKFLRVPNLKPEDVLEILLRFELGTGTSAIEHGKVESLWGIFVRTMDGDEGFKHLPRSYQVMASLLLRVGMLGEVEFLASRMENEGILEGSDQILSNLINAYVDAFEVEKAVSMYDRMKELGLEPSLACYRSVVELMMEMNRTQLAFRVFDDMVEAGVQFGDVEEKNLRDVIRQLSRDGKAQQARKLVKKLKVLGLNPSRVVLNEIARVYCDKKDFDDLVNFFVDMKSAPDACVCNKAIHSLCSSYGLERADWFLQEVKRLGFCPNEITFGILISWSCHYGKLRNAFIYFSEIISNGLNPDRRSYIALISGLFKEGMWQHAQEVVNEMIENGTQPDLVTYNVFLAGYCKARQFGKVKLIIKDMVNNNALIHLSPTEDPLSKAFVILGLDVKVKRDNSIRNSRTEFYDHLGNGLYLETNLDTFDQVLMRVLEESMIPDFNMLIVKECELKNLKTALLMVGEMSLWGQELSLSAFTELVRAQCMSHDNALAICDLLNKMPKLIPLLDQEVLTLLVVSLYNKRRLITAEVGPLIIKEVGGRHRQIENNSTCTALMLGICKTGQVRTIRCCWALLRNEKWLPELKDCDALLNHLCQRKLVKETLELFDRMLVSHPHPHLRAEICSVFLEKLSSTGYTELARNMMQRCKLEPTTYSHHLIKGYCREKRFSEALVVFDSLLANQMVPHADAIVVIIPLLCRATRIEDAIAIMEIGLKQKQHCSHAASSLYDALISGCCGVGEVAKAATLFSEMLFSKQLNPSDDTYNALFQGYCLLAYDDLMKVGELLCAIIRKGIALSVHSYRRFVRLMCEKEDLVFSSLSLRRFFFFFFGECGCGFSTLIIMFNILIFRLFQNGNCHLVEAVLDEMQVLGLEYDEVTYNFLIYGYASSKQMTSSMHYLNGMISKHLRPSSRGLRAVVRYLCSCGQVEKALDLSKDMESRGWAWPWAHSSVIQNLIVQALLSAGRFDEAETFLVRMKETGLTRSKNKIIDYNNLIQKLCSYGRLDMAIDLLNVMLKGGNVPDSESYDSVVYSSCLCNKLNQAMDLFNEMLDRKLSPTISTWDVLAHNLCQNGQTSEAERLLNRMVEHGSTPTPRMYCSLVNSYCFQKKLSKASQLMGMMRRHGYEPDFQTHWSLISNMKSFTDKDDSISSSSQSQGFLSKLLSECGFSRSMCTK
ncbi:hypothetical protein Dimus_014892 [Dionaea muscipula]